MKGSIKLSLLAIVMVFSMSVTAQIHSIKTIEVARNDGWGDRLIEPLGENGFISYSRDGSSLKLEKYDANLSLQFSREIKLKGYYKLKATYATEDKFFMLQMNSSSFGKSNGKYSLITIDLETFSHKIVTGSIRLKGVSYKLCVLKNKAFVGGVKFSEVYVIDIDTGDSKKISLEVDGYKLKKRKPLIDMEVLGQSQELMVYVRAKEMKELSYFAMRFDGEGNRVEVVQFDTNEDKRILSASASVVDDKTTMVLGTFSYGAFKGAMGMYMCKLVEGKVEFIKFNDFSNFDNFFTHLPVFDKGIALNLPKGMKDQELKVSFDVLPLKVAEVDGSYYFLGEVIHSTYEQVQEMQLSGDGKTSRLVNVRRFTGYEFLFASLVKLNGNGEIEWDEAFLLSESNKSKRLKELVRLSVGDEGEINLLYSSNAKLKSKTVSADGESTKMDSFYLEAETENGDIRTIHTNLDFWYDNYFISYGEVTIKEDNKMRESFVISKIFMGEK